MKIAILSDLYPPEIIGGAEKHAADDAKELVKQGHSVHVLTTSVDASFRSFETDMLSGVHVHRYRPLSLHAPQEHQEVPLWRKGLGHALNIWNPLSQAKIGSKLQDIRPDIIHIHNYRGFSAGVFRVAGGVEAPVVHTLHDYASLSARSNLFNDGQINEPGLLMNIYQKVNELAMGNGPDKIIAPSQFIIDKHHEQGVFSNIPAERVPLGINVDELSNTESRAESSDGLRLLYVGQLIKSKGVDVLIDAVSQISNPELEVHILGKGPEKDSLENKAQSDDRIQFHGFVPEDELVRQYSASDFTIVPSRWYDNSPMVIYESFARRTPVIGARIGGIPELIKEGVTGYCFEPDQPSELADLITTHGSEAHELKENLSDVDVELKNHVDKLEDIYSSLSER